MTRPAPPGMGPTPGAPPAKGLSKRVVAGIALGVAVLALGGAAGGYAVFLRTRDPSVRAVALIGQGDLRGALVELRNAVREKPRDPDVHLLLAQTLLRVSEAVAAEKEAKTARSLGADPWAVTPLLGEAYVAQGRWAEVLDEIPRVGPTPEIVARDALSRGVAQIALKDLYAAQTSQELAERGAPGRVEGPLIAAAVAFAGGDRDLAERRVDEALAIDPRKLEALLLKRQLLSARGDAPGALAVADRAVLSSQWSPTARLDRAALLMAAGEDAKAQFDVGAVLARFPRYPAANYLEAVLLARLGRFSEAAVAFEQLRPWADAFPQALYFQSMVATRLGNLSAALEMAGRYHQRAPGDVEGLRMLARAQLASHRPDLAVVLLEQAGQDRAGQDQAGQDRAGQDRPGLSDPETLDILGTAYAASGNVQMGVQTLEQAAAALPANAMGSGAGADAKALAGTVLAHLAIAQTGQGDAATAMRTLGRSMAVAPDQVVALEAAVSASLSTGDLDQARAALDRLRAKAGETEMVGVFGGTLLLMQSDLEAARTAALATLKAFPASIGAKLNLAKVLVLQGRQAQGERQLQELLATEPSNFEVLTTYLQFLLQVGDAKGGGDQKGRFPEAIAAVQRARTAAPANAILTAMEADLLVRSGSARRAIETLRLARQGGERSPLLLAALARAQVMAGLNLEAKASFRELLTAQPTNLEARYGQVALLLQLDEVEAAKAALREGLRVAPGTFPILSALMTLEGRTGGLDGELQLAAAARADPANLPDAALLKGDALIGSKLYAEATEAYRAEYVQAPSSALARRLATAAMAAKQDLLATGILRDWMAGHPGDTDVAQVLARLDVRARRFDDAQKNLELVLARRPRDLVSLNNLAWIYQSKGDKRGRGLAQRAYLQAPDAHTADTLAWIMVQQGEAKAAVGLLQQAVKLAGSDPLLTYHLGVALQESGRVEDAAGLLRSAVATGSAFDGRDDAVLRLSKLTGR